jgi:transcription initiation factor TFIIB
MTSNPNTLPILCSICNVPTNVITDQILRELICTKCGSVLKDGLQDVNLQLNFSNHDDMYLKGRNGVGGGEGIPTSLAKHDKGLYTIIGKTDRDASGQEIKVEMKNRINRWRTWDARSQIRSVKEKNLSFAFIQLRKLKDEFSLPDSIIEKTAYIYRKIQERRLAKGISIKVVISIACYIACRELEIPRTLKEIAEISNTDEKKLFTFYKKAIIELDLKVPQANPLKMIVKIANICKISEKTKRYAINIMNEILKKELFTSKDPMGLAGAIVYMACKKYGENVIQYQIANATGITVVTLRNNLKFIRSCLKY